MQQSLENLNEQLLQEWEDALIAYMYQVKWQQNWDGKTIPKDIVKSICSHAKKLSDSFTLDRSSLDKHYFSKKDVQWAYLLYFHLPNVVRVAACLKEYLDLRIGKNEAYKSELKILDIGCGWGASAWAINFLLKQHWPHIKAKVVLTDQSYAIVSQAQKLFNYMRFSHARVEHTVLDISIKQRLKNLKQQGGYDLIIAANAINEVDDESLEQIDRTLTTFWKHYLNEHGAFVLIEPALHKLSKRMTQLRDQWLEEWQAFTPFPCMHQAACPMNFEKKDWCHFETHWHVPNLRKKIERFLEHKDKALKASYCIFTKEDILSGRSAKVRIISNELKLKQGRSVIACTDQGKQLITLDQAIKKNTYFRGDVYPKHTD